MPERYIIRSRKIFTGLKDEPEAAAILVNGKIIEKIFPWDMGGNEADIPVFDYGEKMVMSSFVDAHTHLFSGAVNASEYVCDSLGTCGSEQECADMIGQYAKKHPELKRIRGTGWFVGAWNDAPLPDRMSLDATVPDRPVYLQCADGHSMWVNSKALEEMHLTENYTVEQGEVCHMEDGSLSGLFIEPAAYRPAEEMYMDFTDEELENIHCEFQKLLAEKGIGALSEMMAHDYTGEEIKTCRLIRRMEEKGKLNAHIFNYTRLFGYTDFTPFFKLKEEMDSAHFHIAGVKGFIDGVTETYTGLLLEPYTDCPDTCGEGVPFRPEEKMTEEIIAANKAGIQVRLHCIADGSVRMALDMYEKSAGETDIRALGNTIEHIENIHPDDVGRFNELGVIPSMQPYHLTLSNNGKIWRLGKERCRYEFPARTMWESTGILAIGTDYPVVGLDPFRTIYAAVTRCDDEGKIVGQNAADQKLPLHVVLKGYTKDSAKVYHADNKMGTLEAGKLANILVLSDNLFEIDPEKIPDTKVLINYFEGKEIYHA